MDVFLEIISFRFVYFSKTILSHRSFFSCLCCIYSIWWKTFMLYCWFIVSYQVSIMFGWFTCIYIPFELCSVHWCHYMNLFLFHAFIMHQAKSLTIMFFFLDITLSRTLLYLGYNFLYVCMLQDWKISITRWCSGFP